MGFKAFRTLLGNTQNRDDQEKEQGPEENKNDINEYLEKHQDEIRKFLNTGFIGK